MIRPILQVPDPVLRQTAQDVTHFDGALGSLIQDMFETMYAAPGRGLAAPQIGVLSRVFVMDAGWKSGNETPLACFNPVILAISEKQVSQDEGCLSIPGPLVSVKRPAKVKLRFQSADGAAQERWFTGFEAVCVQHERDHLDGILCTDLAEDAV